MHAVKDRRKDEETSKSLCYKLKSRIRGSLVFCRDCRKMTPIRELANKCGERDSAKYPRCIKCHEAREQRIKAHQRRVQKEMARRAAGLKRKALKVGLAAVEKLPAQSPDSIVTA